MVQGEKMFLAKLIEWIMPSDKNLVTTFGIPLKRCDMCGQEEEEKYLIPVAMIGDAFTYCVEAECREKALGKISKVFLNEEEEN